MAIIVGHSSCSYERALDGPAIWTATMIDDMICKWCVDDDTKENRDTLNIL